MSRSAGLTAFACWRTGYAVCLVGSDREVGEVATRIVVCVVAEREVARAERHSHVADADARGRREQPVHQLGPLARRQLGRHEPGRRVGHGGAEAVHLLVAVVLVHVDREPTARLGTEAEARLRLQELAAVAGREPRGDRLVRGRRARRREREQHQHGHGKQSKGGAGPAAVAVARASYRSVHRPEPLQGRSASICPAL